MKRGDRSVIDLLRIRYAAASTYRQKHTIAAALLRRASDDRPYWNELFEHARNAVRFAEEEEMISDELRAWCAERGYDPFEYHRMSADALGMVANDPRSRALLLEALDGGVEEVMYAAVWGLAAQHDLSALPAIERALAKSSDAALLALCLEPYRVERADQIAFQYLGADEREHYFELRNAPPDEEQP